MHTFIGIVHMVYDENVHFNESITGFRIETMHVRERDGEGGASERVKDGSRNGKAARTKTMQSAMNQNTQRTFDISMGRPTLFYMFGPLFHVIHLKRVMCTLTKYLWRFTRFSSSVLKFNRNNRKRLTLLCTVLIKLLCSHEMCLYK